MIIEYGIKYKNSEKNLKKRHEELKSLDMIKNHIKICENFNDLQNNAISKLYGFEPLKYGLNGYYSFNLNKNGGKIRLIFSIDEIEEIVTLEYISINHYEDFKSKL